MTFTIKTNTGEPFLPLAKIASGGEISRLMLAMKSVAATQDPIPTLIFDEIDVGVGGMLAHAIGETLRGLGLTRQVLCISHLHQIAARADHHFRVEKQVSDDRAITRVMPLEGEEKIGEIARMMGDLSDVSRHHAEELMKRNPQSPESAA
jgi:DNA repair protein RecN (Recombination protein N)